MIPQHKPTIYPVVCFTAQIAFEAECPGNHHYGTCNIQWLYNVVNHPQIAELQIYNQPTLLLFEMATKKLATLRPTNQSKSTTNQPTNQPTNQHPTRPRPPPKLLAICLNAPMTPLFHHRCQVARIDTQPTVEELCLMSGSIMVQIWGFPKMVVPNNYWFSY